MKNLQIQTLIQNELNDLVRDLELPKVKAKLLASRMKNGNISDAKIREGAFTSPDIRSLLRDEVFEHIIMGDEQRAWHAFREVVTGFLGNRRAENYKDLVE